MNINPRTWFAGRKGASGNIDSSALVRAQMAMGPWQQAIGMFIPREVNPWFLEALRESLGILDGAVNAYVMLDGILDVEGGNDKLVQLIQRELFGNIPVGDKGAGLQGFYAGMGQEQYEQGFSVSEMVFDRRGRELIALRVADSKGVLFHRNLDTGFLETWYLPPMPNALGRRDGTDSVQNVLRNSPRQLNVNLIQGHGYTQLNPSTMLYSVFNPENDMPYGVSLFRGIEFVSQILLRMHNAQSQAWDRFGDPVFHVNYKTANRAVKDITLDSRRRKLSDDLAATLNAKRQGNSADLVTAVGSDDTITIDVIGGNNKVLSIEMPANHMMEQVLAKTGLASWMLGVQLGRAPSGLADNQAEVMLQQSKTRFESRTAALTSLVATWLRGRGLAWQPGDWQLVQRLPNLRDELKRAQAKFLEAQTQLMLSGAGVKPVDASPQTTGPQSNDMQRPKKAVSDITASLFDDPIVRSALSAAHGKHAGHAHKGAGMETWASTDPNLPRLTTAAVAALQSAWHALATDTLRALEVPVTKGADQAFTFDLTGQLQKLMQLQAEFITANAGSDSALVKLALQIWARGIENAAAGVDQSSQAEQVIANARAMHAAALESSLRTALQKTTVRVYENDIVQALTDGVYNGTNPRQVASELAKKFDSHDYDFQRLSESEMAAAHAQGNLDALAASGIEKYDWLPAPEACSICTAIAEAGPYTVGAGPMPVRDSHPGCFCVINGVVD